MSYHKRNLSDPIEAWWDGYDRGLFHGLRMRYVAIAVWILNILLLVYLIVSKVSK